MCVVVVPLARLLVMVVMVVRVAVLVVVVVEEEDGLCVRATRSTALWV